MYELYGIDIIIYFQVEHESNISSVNRFKKISINLRAKKDRHVFSNTEMVEILVRYEFYRQKWERKIRKYDAEGNESDILKNLTGNQLRDKWLHMQRYRNNFERIYDKAKKVINILSISLQNLSIFSEFFLKFNFIIRNF
jgi:hypothetical protein